MSARIISSNNFISSVESLHFLPLFTVVYPQRTAGDQTQGGRVALKVARRRETVMERRGSNFDPQFSRPFLPYA